MANTITTTTTTATNAATTTSSYIDVPTLLSPTFSPYTHAASLIARTNGPTDAPVDLTTPLSRALFDAQEIDAHVHAVASGSAVPILEFTRERGGSAERVLEGVEVELAKLKAGWEGLEAEVLGRWERADEARRGAERGGEVVRLLRGVARVVGVARAVEGGLEEAGLVIGGGGGGRVDHRAVLRATYGLLAFREIMMGSEGPELARVNIVKALRGRVFEDGEEKARDWARKCVREFSAGSLNTGAGQTFKDAEEAKARFTSAVHVLYLLSPAPRVDGARIKKADFEMELLIRALQAYLQTAITSSSAGIGRALATLPNLERTLAEVSARCQSVMALEVLLRSIGRPENPGVDEGENGEGKDEDIQGTKQEKRFGKEENLLDPLLHALDTASLPSYFWRSLASSLTTRVQEILNRGGVSEDAAK